MKKVLSFLTLCLGLCIVSCYDDTAILDRLEALESTTIASINEQITAIKGSISDLEAMDRELDAAIGALEKENEKQDKQLQSYIDSLKTYDGILNARIEELNAYVDAELASTKDWANATFSTLEQYEATCDEIAAIKVLISEQEASLMQAISNAVSASEESIKGWVNEQLTGYWTIAETQAKLDIIKANTDEEITALKNDLKVAKEELTAAYQSEIKKAIEDANGKLSSKIDEINAILEKKINDIEIRLTAIEEKLNNLTREFTIEFDDTEIGVVPGGSSTVSYTIIGGTEKTIVKALGQNGWSAKVTPNGYDKGTITVKAPDPITESEIIVLVYDGEYRTIMSTINFMKGYATPSQTAVEFGVEADTVSITLTANLSYNVSIPEEAQSWLSVVEPAATRAITTETISFACTECIGGIRKAKVTFRDDTGVAISTMTFIQQGSAVEVTLTEAGTLLEAMGKDVYLDIKGLIINGPINGTDILYIRKMRMLEYLDMTNVNIVEGGEPYYDNHTTENNFIGHYMFSYATCFQEGNCKVILPKNVTKIGDCAFRECKGLSSIICPSALLEIGQFAFADTFLDNIQFNENLKFIDDSAFDYCNFSKIVIPSGVEEIRSRAFARNPLTEVHLKALPSTLTELGGNIFEDAYDNATLYIPKGTYEEYSKTDFGRFKNIVEE